MKNHFLIFFFFLIYHQINAIKNVSKTTTTGLSLEYEENFECVLKEIERKRERYSRKLNRTAINELLRQGHHFTCNTFHAVHLETNLIE